MALYANQVSVSHHQSFKTSISDPEVTFLDFWSEYRMNPMAGRNIILDSFCPQVYGLGLVKLAVMLVLVGGVAHRENGTFIRGDSHMLLIGDPGTAKSKLLRFAALISPRSVLTTGIGSTNAGLTCAAVKDSGEWQLEAGALVLADRGVCCIDEFSSIREADKTSIHEAMEQQSISVAKAGLVCKLNSRCSVLAATNPKGKYDTEQNIEINTALGSPLLSRFDIIMIMLDSTNLDWDVKVSKFVLDAQLYNTARESVWGMDKLQSYIQYVKNTYFPEISSNAQKVLSAYYQLQRASDLRNAARTTIRLLESLIRLAQAHAKLLCKDTVDITDAVVAIQIIEGSMLATSLGGVLALNECFSSNPDQDFQETIVQILGQLGLPELVEQALDNVCGSQTSNYSNLLCSARDASQHSNASNLLFSKTGMPETLDISLPFLDESPTEY
jgi:DNA helicase MCM9